MTENNELNDIILNKGNSASSNKKIILAVATLGVVLIIVVMLMNSLSSSSNENLPQAVLPPKPQMQQNSPVADEPLFEEVEVVNDDSSSDADLDKIAKKLKAESLQNDKTEEPEVIQTNKVTTIKPKVEKTKSVATVAPSKTKRITTPKAVTKGTHYVQVGSFSKYEPNKKFLSKITKLGYSYTYHKVGSLNKVLVGPFKTTTDAKKARKVLRSKVEPGAFLVHL